MFKNDFQKADWNRVNKKTPCVICKKYDWCTFTEQYACCMRVSSDKKMKNGGFLHKLTEDLNWHPIPVTHKVLKQEIDCESIWSEFNKKTTPQSLIIFAEKLGVDPMALHLLECCWNFRENAWAFPMKDETEKIIGIRLRDEMGNKWAVRGSRSGLFVPTMVDPSQTLYITEGPTDCAACLCMGLSVIGRPSCIGLEGMVNDFIKIKKIKRCVILADNDAPGLAGADRLQEGLKIPSCILTLPKKDAREFYVHGGTKSYIESKLKNMVWNKV